MPFDPNKFMIQNFSQNTREVTIPSLQPFFGKDKPLFILRGLTGVELAEVHEAIKVNAGIENIVDKILAPKMGDKVDALKAAMGLTGKVPDDIVRRLEMLVRCSVKPPITLDVAVKLCEVYPVEFYQLTGVITELTGQGKIPGKSRPSGQTRK